MGSSNARSRSSKFASESAGAAAAAADEAAMLFCDKKPGCDKLHLPARAKKVTKKGGAGRPVLKWLRAAQAPRDLSQYRANFDQDRAKFDQDLAKFDQDRAKFRST